jgi:hypothetical protein
MNKLYLVPLSLLFLNFATAEEQTHFDSEIALFRPKTQETIALEIDPELIDEIKEEISAVLKNPALESEDQEQGMTASLEKPSRTAQRQTRGNWVDEEEWQEEEIAVPRQQARSASQVQTEQGSTREETKPHVRRYPAPHIKPPRTQREPNRQDQHTRPAKPLSTQPNDTVEANPQSRNSKRSLAKTEEESDEFEQPSQKQSNSQKRKSFGAKPQNPRLNSQYEEETAEAEFEQPARQQRPSSLRQQNQASTAKRKPANARAQNFQPQSDEETADAEFEQPARQQRPSSVRENRQNNPAKKSAHAKAQNSRQQAKEETAEAEFEQPIQKRQPSTRQSSPRLSPNLTPNSPKEKRQMNWNKRQEAKNPSRSHPSVNYSDQRTGVAQVGEGHDQIYYPEDETTGQEIERRRQMNRQKKQNMQMQPQMAQQNMMMVNTPVRPMIKEGFDLWIMGDALLWQAVEENLTYAYSGRGDYKNLHTVDFQWDWGFRLGIGYNLPRDGWDLDLYWTHIRNTAHGEHHSESQLFQVWTVADHVLQGTGRASSHWRVHLDQVDLDLGRQFYVGKCLSIRPFIGMRSAWIFQEDSIDFSTATAKQDAKLKNRFWGFGFAAGLDSDWKLGGGVSLYGEADMSILLGFFDVDQRGRQGESSIWAQDKSFRVGRTIMDLGMGLKWSTLFFDDSIGLTLKAGYEYHLYYDQNQFILTNGSTNLELFNPVHGDLIYQGVIGSVQVDF